MKKATVARRFAKALIDIAVEEKSADKFGKDLRAALGVFEANPGLTKILLNPMYRIEERKGLMEQVSGSVAVSPAVGKFLGILVETRSIKLLDDIVRAYQRLEDGLSGRIRA